MNFVQFLIHGLSHKKEGAILDCNSLEKPKRWFVAHETERRFRFIIKGKGHDDYIVSFCLFLLRTNVRNLFPNQFNRFYLLIDSYF